MFVYEKIISTKERPVNFTNRSSFVLFYLSTQWRQWGVFWSCSRVRYPQNGYMAPCGCGCHQVPNFKCRSLGTPWHPSVSALWDCFTAKRL